MNDKPDIVERLRRPGGTDVDDLINLSHAAAAEIERLRALVDAAGVTIALAMLNGLPPLPWRSAPSHGRRLILIDAKGSKIGAIWGEHARRVTATILALVNQNIGAMRNVK